jgi:hypothetical protein
MNENWLGTSGLGAWVAMPYSDAIYPAQLVPPSQYIRPVSVIKPSCLHNRDQRVPQRALIHVNPALKFQDPPYFADAPE